MNKTLHRVVHETTFCRVRVCDRASREKSLGTIDVPIDDQSTAKLLRHSRSPLVASGLKRARRAQRNAYNSLHNVRRTTTTRRKRRWRAHGTVRRPRIYNFRLWHAGSSVVTKDIFFMKLLRADVSKLARVIPTGIPIRLPRIPLSRCRGVSRARGYPR